MNGTKLESVKIASSLKFSQQCKAAAGKANRMLDFINRKFSLEKKSSFYHCISV